MAVRIGVAGAGAMGVRHVEAMRACRDAELAGIVDPSGSAAAYAEQEKVDHFTSLADAFSSGSLDAVILATPNQHHVEGALECIEAGIPVLVEKPLATDLAGALRLVGRAEALNVPLLTGHHRRHNPLVQAAKARIEAGDLGRIVAAHGMFWAMKPDDYFDIGWRRQKGAGPIYLNFIHDIDLMRHLVGEVASVQAVETNAIRGNEVEDAAGMLMTFDNGAIGTFTVSDSIVSPWSWELSSRENPAYPPADATCYWIGGTQSSLELPNAALWSHAEKPSWWEPIGRTPLMRHSADPLVLQVQNLADVVAGRARPVVSGREGLKTLAIIDAIKEATASGKTVEPGRF
ncbi:Gfo/Idh/MocA family protein [Nitratireductor luteus]|uniref:Gfo/Idh/MocA family protein n=1 Tax=Nitratireductor luteus TaxID=2976980 RepID=UPI00223ED0E5|nr:Gfo/Idh/MocA family oxidoreductase [Nitratireductor luteus]